MAKMRAVAVAEPGGAFELVEREIPEPDRGEARVQVQACGVCHSDSIAKEGRRPGLSYPLVPGHEVAGVIDALGEGVAGWEVGQRVGVGWFGGNCGHCEPCRRGVFMSCVNSRTPGVTMDGGYADYLVVPASALALIPDDLRAEDAAPLLCAGVTTYNALRHSGASAGDLVAILGVGGLGHLGVQFAVKQGFETVAIARGRGKEPLARKLGAHHYIDSTSQDVAAALTELGGARVVLATVTSADAMSATVGERARAARATGRRRRVGGAAGGLPGSARQRQQDGFRARLGHLDGLAGHAVLQRVERSTADDRDAAARAGRRGLRADDERRRALPHGAHDRQLTSTATPPIGPRL
jgi:D-arabinose 1-dehydrogenase-like Zn-dependent alcohol dehydrogenase